MNVYLCNVNYYEFLPAPLARIRYAAFNLCHARWAIQAFIKLEVITAHSLNCSRQEFQRKRRMYAEEQSKGEYYIVADDDCLPPAALQLSTITDIMDAHPEFAILAMQYHGMALQVWDGYRDNDVMEHVSVGGIRFCREIGTWPPIPISGGYDYIQAEAIREQGRKVGYLSSIPPMAHLCEGRTMTSAWS